MEKKKIKLISPKMSKRPMDSHFKVQMSPPLCLLVLAGLTPQQYEVYVEDENVEKLNLSDQPDLVGITVKADTRNRSVQIAEAYRKRGIPVVMGGIHPTSCHADCTPFADSVVVGEAELIWPRLLDDFTRRRLRPLYHQTTPVFLCHTPLPRWELLKGKNYLFTNTLVMSRGCPFACDFCYSSNANIHSGYRTQSPPASPEWIEAISKIGFWFNPPEADQFPSSPKGYAGQARQGCVFPAARHTIRIRAG